MEITNPQKKKVNKMYKLMEACFCHGIKKKRGNFVRVFI